MEKINVPGIGPVLKCQVLVALFNMARTQGMAAMHYRSGHIMNENEALQILKTTQNFDYLEGRVLKVNLGRPDLDLYLYDRDNGNGAGYEAILEYVTRPPQPKLDAHYWEGVRKGF